MNEITRIELSSIRADGGGRPRAVVRSDKVLEYATDMYFDVEFPPIVLFFDGSDYWLADGFHRFEAAVKCGLRDINADVRRGTRRDAILLSVEGADGLHGQRRSDRDTRRAALWLLNDEEWGQWSDSEIASRCGATVKTVGFLRRSSIPGNPQENENLINRSGTIYNEYTSGIERYSAETVEKIADLLESARIRSGGAYDEAAIIRELLLPKSQQEILLDIDLLKDLLWTGIRELVEAEFEIIRERKKAQHLHAARHSSDVVVPLFP